MTTAEKNIIRELELQLETSKRGFLKVVLEKDETIHGLQTKLSKSETALNLQMQSASSEDKIGSSDSQEYLDTIDELVQERDAALEKKVNLCINEILLAMIRVA